MNAAPKKPAKKPPARKAKAGDLVTTRTGYARLKPAKKTAGPGKKAAKRPKPKPAEEKKRGWF